MYPKNCENSSDCRLSVSTFIIVDAPVYAVGKLVALVYGLIMKSLKK